MDLQSAGFALNLIRGLSFGPMDDPTAVIMGEPDPEHLGESDYGESYASMKAKLDQYRAELKQLGASDFEVGVVTTAVLAAGTLLGTALPKIEFSNIGREEGVALLAQCVMLGAAMSMRMER